MVAHGTTDAHSTTAASVCVADGTAEAIVTWIVDGAQATEHIVALTVVAYMVAHTIVVAESAAAAALV